MINSVKTFYIGQSKDGKWHTGALTIKGTVKDPHYYITRYGITHEVDKSTVVEHKF